MLQDALTNHRLSKKQLGTRLTWRSKPAEVKIMKGMSYRQSSFETSRCRCSDHLWAVSKAQLLSRSVSSATTQLIHLLTWNWNRWRTPKTSNRLSRLRKMIECPTGSKMLEKLRRTRYCFSRRQDRVPKLVTCLPVSSGRVGVVAPNQMLLAI